MVLVTVCCEARLGWTWTCGGSSRRCRRGCWLCGGDWSLGGRAGGCGNSNLCCGRYRCLGRGSRSWGWAGRFSNNTVVFASSESWAGDAWVDGLEIGNRLWIVSENVERCMSRKQEAYQAPSRRNYIKISLVFIERYGASEPRDMTSEPVLRVELSALETQIMKGRNLHTRITCIAIVSGRAEVTRHSLASLNHRVSILFTRVTNCSILRSRMHDRIQIRSTDLNDGSGNQLRHKRQDEEGLDHVCCWLRCVGCRSSCAVK